MNNITQEKTDVVSAILDNKELLDAFADTLEVEEPASLGRVQKIRCYLWKKIKDVMSILSHKIQVLAVLAEYNFKNEEKKIHVAMIKKNEEKFMLVLNMNGERNNKEEHPDISHIPNDQPIPTQYPEDKPERIPVDEPTGPDIPGPIQAPIREPNKRPKIRVLNIQ